MGVILSRWLHSANACLLLIGLLGVALLTPPLMGFDEKDHLYRTAQVASGVVLPEVAPYGNRTRIAGGEIDERFPALLAGYYAEALAANTVYVRPSPGDTAARFAVRASGVRRFQPFTNTAIYSPIPYLAPVTAVAAARLLDLPLLDWLYLGRIACAASAAALMLVALSRAGPLRPYFVVLSSIPMMLSQCGTLSADALVLAACFPLAVILARVAEGAELSTRGAAAVGVLLTAICVGKLGYVPLATLPFLVGWRRHGLRSPTTRRAAAAAVLVLLVWAAWAWQIRHDVFCPRPELTDATTPGRQVEWIAAHPMLAARIIAGSAVGEAPHMALALLGTWMFYDHVLIRLKVIGLVAGALIFLGLATTAWRNTDRRLLALALLLFATCYGLIYLLLYLQFTRTGWFRVEGVQGRYFLPLVILAPVALRRKATRAWVDREALAATAVQAISVGAVLIGVWRLH